MLTSLGRRMGKHSENFNQKKKRKQKKVTNRSHWTEEYSNWFDICAGGVQPHTTWSKEKKSECKDRAVKLTWIRTAETKKNFKKWTQLIGQHQAN